MQAVNFRLFEILLFCFKILFYQYGVTEAELIVYEMDEPVAIVNFIVEDDVLKVYSTEGDEKAQIMEVVTVDNALYDAKIIFMEDEPTTLDLAPYYTGIEWDQISVNEQDVLIDDELVLQIRPSEEKVFFILPETELKFSLDISYFKN